MSDNTLSPEDIAKLKALLSGVGTVSAQALTGIPATQSPQGRVYVAPREVKFRYVKKRVLNVTTFLLAGFSLEEAKRQAIQDKKYYYSEWPQFSLDNGKTWHFTPPARDIPRLDIKYDD